MEKLANEVSFAKKTKSQIRRSLTVLLKTKELSDISVCELTKLSDISRGTFYFHYADIYALMEQMESVQLARLESLMDNLIPNISREDVPPALTALFSYMNDNPEVCHAFYGKNWESDFTRNAKELIARRCLGQLQANGGGTQRQQYLLAFAVNGCFGSIVAWQDAGCQPPPEEMAAITWQAIRAVKVLL